MEFSFRRNAFANQVYSLLYKIDYVGSTCENEADTSTRYLIGEQIGMVLIMFVAGIVAAILYLKYFKKKSARNEEEFLTPDQFGS